MTLKELCPDFDEWPERWKGVEADVPYGQGLIDAMRPFVEHLIASGLARRTLHRHLSYLWLLGGEIVRRVALYENHDTPALEMLRETVQLGEAPLTSHLESEAELREFDTTCRKLHRFLEA